MERESEGRDAGTRPRAGLVARLEDAGPVRALLLTGAVLGALAAVVAAVTWAVGAARDVSDPHREQYAALEQLDLDVRLEYFEENFGVARSVVDLCTRTFDCDESSVEELQLYTHETDEVTVRAVFADNRLELYTVTTNASGFEPPVVWLGHELGALGRFTSAEALAAVDVEPTDIAAFAGAQAFSYADVVSIGAPAGYRALILGWAPEGFAGPSMHFDVDAVVAMNQAGEPQEVPEMVARFRDRTTPNTYGEFRDDGGFVADLGREAEDVITILFSGSEI